MPEFRLHQLLAQLGLDAPEAPDIPIRGLATLEDAGPDQIAFAESKRYLEQVIATQAALVLAPADFPPMPDRHLLRVEKPRLSFLRLAECFVEGPAFSGIHPAASVHPEANLAAGVSIGACAVISRAVRVSTNSLIGPGVFLGEGVSIGADCRIDANVSILPGVSIGDRVIIRSNTSIGGEGFGYVWIEDHHHPVPQLGRVVIDDGVEIGCNCCIDRATLGVTRIGRGTKIDNQVHIAHNCEIGEHVILVAQLGLAGGVKIGAGALLGGQVAVANNVSIGAGAKVGACTGVMQDIAPGEAVLGAPSRERRQFMKEQASLSRLPDALKQIKAMQRELDALRGRLAALEK
ncbi:MAG: UDP-3-O-(3-hydroxymyristoyl)glucosamine N-acyltransferase [Gammaproteobacteria bacterium]|nr:UDP-3-O-(3-hydroxymyristoyl)glucosamine N-acyltransferase [Gammaproteobacteria bacterium]MBU1654460.1 UDP-3-O-(3-hydroxymyristoyl)glucosamine N-acyltransferase [Gammaproteobacteria bacterium]MBU1962618.1 UDP-3-O-(3-hydroxymyristoyl)glucosamine N-acyltransferase [Gammaproteobacteria bacterium]